jgi:trimethylamine corrinoid protein
MEIAERAKKAIIDGDSDAAAACAREWLACGGSPLDLIDGALTPGIREVGDLWERGDYFLPELVSSAEAMKAAMAILEPGAAGEGAQSRGPIAVIGTVEGDIHDIGKTLVASMLRANGFKIFDLGVDVSPGRFLDTAREKGAGLVCLSALLTTTMTGIKDVIRLFQSEPLGGKVRFLVGGAPVTREWAREIGADGYAANAVEAVAAARELMEL